jgi:hypothetical protein
MIVHISQKIQDKNKQTHDFSASAFQVLVLQACSTLLGYDLPFYTLPDFVLNFLSNFY